MLTPFLEWIGRSLRFPGRAIALLILSYRLLPDVLHYRLFVLLVARVSKTVLLICLTLSHTKNLYVLHIG